MTIEFFDLEELRLPPGVEKWATVPVKIQKQRQQWVKLPMTWYEKLLGEPASTHRLACYLLHQNWKEKGGPIKLANGMLRLYGISRYSKWRALRKLERLGLITVECRGRCSPIVRVL
jgi:hypothetical protein